MDNNDFWDIKKEEKEMERIAFKINQLKLEHFYFNSGDKDAGMPISTSVELSCEYNFERNNLGWKKSIVHNYVSLEDSMSISTDSHDEVLDNADEIISKIESCDLRYLNNNYFNEDTPERFTHWEITYNNHFKIVGTYDNEIDEFKELSEILDFKMIMDEEVKKIQDKMKSEQS